MPTRPFSQRLTLVAWFTAKLGYGDNAEMLADLRESREDWEGGRHPVSQLLAFRGKAKIETDVLRIMDDNIHADLQKINAARRQPITLKYFQYLAALAVEYFLLRRAEDAVALSRELRVFAADAPAGRYPAPESIEHLDKLALWMATGAGKTLLMHLNYHQFMRRRAELFTPDNVILLTPNETLSEQHINEMRDSGIPCFRHGDGAGGLAFGGGFPVRVLEMTKLTEEKRGVVTMPTSEFEGRNLLLVDEGHKGAGGKAFFARRDELARDGFAFEYSATYGQVFKRAGAARPSERENECARSVVCDYSYRHFHGDGYGKDFDVVNLGAEPQADKDKPDTLMLGNLLVFLQQRACFAENRAAFARHNIEPPLLLLLGTTVTGGAKVSKASTDIVDYLRFLHRVAERQPWAESTIAQITQSETGIKDAAGRDVFHGRLKWLNMQYGGDPERGVAADPRRVYDALLRHVFRAEQSGALQFCPIHGAKDEVALRVSGGSHFGLVYVGKGAMTKLRDLLQTQCPGVKTFDETLARPMFHEVANADSPVNILIGAKKFMEGWSSWRVSGMGLLNVGKSEGPLIIQLFGRGVRLKGAGMSLKRGGGGNPTPHQGVLETMNIFGIRADFISNFREMLEREGVWEETLHIPISPPPDKAFNSGLIVPEYPAAGFARPVTLAPDKKIRVQLDLSSSASRTGSQTPDQAAAAPPRSEPRPLSEAALGRVDWNNLHCALQEYRARAGLWNLAIEPRFLRDILSACCAVIHDADAPLAPTSERGIRRIRNAAFALLRQYAERFYNRRRADWARKNMAYKPLTSEHLGLPRAGTQYTLAIPRGQDGGNEEIIAKLRELIGNEGRLEKMWASDSKNWNDPPPRIYFDRHLYQPLLLADYLEQKRARVSPQALNQGEYEFVRALRSYLHQNPPPDNEELYLLRNQSRLGVGLHSDAGSVFPDFILWQKHSRRQRIVFVEPHGMRQAPAYENDAKARLHETLADINRRMAEDEGYRHITMDSYVVSQTPYDELRAKYGGDWSVEKFREKHILFPPDEGLIARILGGQ